MDFINALIDNYNIPILTAFLLGVLTSISPCPLATNITAIAFISKEIKLAKNTLLNGIFYTIGRSVSYTILAALIYFGLSSFKISNIFQGWGDKLLGPALILIGLFMLNIIKINFGFGKEGLDKLKIWFAKKGFLGSFLLGVLFALAFCPYSGVLFFGILIPLILKSNQVLILASSFAVGTGLAVIVFSLLIAFSLSKVGKTFQIIKNMEKWIRYVVSFVFLGVGIYYTYFLIKFLMLRFG